MPKYLIDVIVNASIIVEAEDADDAFEVAEDEYSCPRNHEVDSMNAPELLTEEEEAQARRFGAVNAWDA